MSRLVIEPPHRRHLPHPELWSPPPPVGRRAALRVAAGVTLGGLLLAARRGRADDCALPARTPIEGPYFLGTPEEKADTGQGLVVRGRVLGPDCQPIAGAIITRWHANRLGIYEEFYRATMTSRADGSFAMSTTPPGRYANLDRHIHWYVTAPGHAPLLAQLQWRQGETIGAEETFDFSLVAG